MLMQHVTCLHISVYIYQFTYISLHSVFIRTYFNLTWEAVPNHHETAGWISSIARMGRCQWIGLGDSGSGSPKVLFVARNDLGSPNFREMLEPQVLAPFVGDRCLFFF